MGEAVPSTTDKSPHQGLTSRLPTCLLAYLPTCLLAYLLGLQLTKPCTKDNILKKEPIETNEIKQIRKVHPTP
jgi:hypothetical protein